jgi:oxygen-independent coproporphyrinogen-3 oxidase
MSVSLDDTRVLRGLTAEFLQRYNRVGPRYTSYPTAPEWTEAVGQGEYRANIRERCAADPGAPLSLYFHIPFCEHRCRFCACNVIATRRREVSEPYLRDLDKEMAVLAGDLAASGGENRPVTQLHFGGGTPTYLAPDQLAWIMGRIRSHFRIAPDAEISIEIDPCVTTDEHIRTLRALGFNRASLGVQDFHGPTQEIIERIQTVEETVHITELARELGFESVNFDLVYGLPLQTRDTFAYTLDQVLAIRPDRVALYNFAYLPQRLGHQRQIDTATLPTGPQKFEVFVSAFERFSDAGYEHIGMDHFAVPEDPLARARRDRTIQRNFMGYTTQAGTDLCAFGVSSISATDRVYAQNTKKLPIHTRAVESGELPVERGYVLSDEDRLRRAVICAFMCHGHLEKAPLEEQFGIDFDDHFAAELSELLPMERDGLLHLRGDRIEVTLLGNIFVRNIGMVFDTYLRAPHVQPAFSRTL